LKEKRKYFFIDFEEKFDDVENGLQKFTGFLPFSPWLISKILLTSGDDSPNPVWNDCHKNPLIQ
jgi:hypothetical protein